MESVSSMLTYSRGPKNKRVDISSICSWCVCSEEDVIHVLFECSFARTVWTNIGMQEVIREEQQRNVLYKMQQIFSKYGREKLAWIVMICWSLWNRRNKWVWDKNNVSTFGVQSMSSGML